MRVLVTGAAGFVGTHLAAALDGRGHHVVSIDRRWGTSTAEMGELPGSLVAGELLAHLVGPPRVNLVVHLGAQCSTARSLADPVADFHDNAVGTFNVAEASRRAGGIPVVFTSTCKVVEGHDDLVAPLGLSKSVGEEYLRLYRQLYGVASVVLRPSTVYGPGQDGTAESGWVSWFARAALTGAPVEVAGDGSQSRDVLFIDDFVALLVDIVENFPAYDEAGGRAHDRGDAFEVGGGQANEVSLLELLAELGHTHVRHGPRPPGDLDRVVSDNRAVSAVRGWAPTVGWRDGLGRTVGWLKAELGGG